MGGQAAGDAESLLRLRDSEKAAELLRFHKKEEREAALERKLAELRKERIELNFEIRQLTQREDKRNEPYVRFGEHLLIAAAYIVLFPAAVLLMMKVTATVGCLLFPGGFFCGGA